MTNGGMLKPRLHEWHAYLCDNKQLSDWTKGMLNKKKTMLGTRNSFLLCVIETIDLGEESTPHPILSRLVHGAEGPGDRA